MLGSRGGGAQAGEVRWADGVLGGGDGVAAVAVERLAYTHRNDLTADAFLNGKPNTVYAIAPEHQQELLRPIIVALVSQLYVAAVERANTGNTLGGEYRWDPSLRFLLDEAANIAPLRPLPNYLAQSLGLGIPS